MTRCWVVAIFLFAAKSQAAPTGCALCHKAQVASFDQSRMTHALATPTGTHSTTLNGISYKIDANTYTVADATQTFRATLAWAFGQGTAGQTYLYLQDGTWYESRVSFFSAIDGLDLTMGTQNITPHTLAEHAGRPLSQHDATECFNCHATNSTTTLIPGIQCDRCHGPSTGHLTSNTPMKKLHALSTEQMSDFCGQCHRTWSQIAAAGPHDIQNIRFQPYRLTNSKCYDVDDPRIRCTACHDPHGPLEVNATAYDAKCLACHAKAPARICHTATTACTTCHMPQLDLPGAHKKFTDHRIRIVKPNEKYPD
jgi:formate-dependent nitrite reductase cytochrome c552 subunit